MIQILCHEVCEKNVSYKLSLFLSIADNLMLIWGFELFGNSVVPLCCIWRKQFYDQSVIIMRVHWLTMHAQWCRQDADGFHRRRATASGDAVPSVSTTPAKQLRRDAGRSVPRADLPRRRHRTPPHPAQLPARPRLRRRRRRRRRDWHYAHHRRCVRSWDRCIRSTSKKNLVHHHHHHRRLKICTAPITKKKTVQWCIIKITMLQIMVTNGYYNRPFSLLSLV